MRKKILGGIAVLAIAAVVAINVNLNASNSNNLSDLSLANVEALAESEIGEACGGCSSSCRGTYCCTIIFNGTGFALNRCN